MTDDYTPRFVGDLANPLLITLTDHLGVPYNVSGNTLSTDFALSLIPLFSATTIIGGGTWTFTTNGTDGGVTYTWVAGDVAVAGTFAIRVKAKVGGQWLNFETKQIVFESPAVVN